MAGPEFLCSTALVTMVIHSMDSGWSMLSDAGLFWSEYIVLFLGKLIVPEFVFLVGALHLSSSLQYGYLACDACLDSDTKKGKRRIQQTVNGMLDKVKLGLIHAAE